MKSLLIVFFLGVTAVAQEPARITLYSGTGNAWKNFATLGAGRKPVTESDFNIFIDGQHFVLARAKHYFITARLPAGRHVIVARTGKNADDKENARIEIGLKAGERKFVLTQMFYSGFYMVQKRSV